MGLRAAACTLTRTSPDSRSARTGTLSLRTRAFDGCPRRTTVHARCTLGIWAMMIGIPSPSASVWNRYNIYPAE